jgi:hypothetical protein
MKLTALNVTPHELAELINGLDAAAVHDADAAFLSEGDFNALRERLHIASVQAMSPEDRAAMEAELD